MSKLQTRSQVRRVSRVLGSQRDQRRISPTLSRLGKNIQKEMKAKNLTYNQLAVVTGFPVNTIKDWAHGNSFPSNDRFSKLAKALKINQSKLILGDEHVE